MNTILKNIIFYITIVENNKNDHSFLRKVIHSVLPQAIVDSVYNENEALNYFNNCTTIPHLLFIDQDMLKISGRNTMDLIKRVDGLNQVPVIFLTNSSASVNQQDFRKLGANNFYSKPYEAQTLLNIVSSVNNKWLA